jgi:integrase
MAFRSGRSYRKWWRQIARAAGLPDEVWSMDARAGAITEADDAGVDFKKLQDFATHTDATSTERYRRRRERGNREVAKARAELRKAGGAGDKNGGSN